VHDILGTLAFFILIGAQFAAVIVVHRWQTENRSTTEGKRTTDLKAPRITALSCLMTASKGSKRAQRVCFSPESSRASRHRLMSAKGQKQTFSGAANRSLQGPLQAVSSCS
jgi:hypothetical protein